MPRLENSGTAVNDFCERTGEGSSTFDLCKGCAAYYRGNTTAGAGLKLYHQGEPNGTLEGDVEHPDYDDLDYKCEICDHLLTDRHDY